MKPLALLLFLPSLSCSFAQKVNDKKNSGITQVKNVIDAVTEKDFKPYHDGNEEMYDDFYYNNYDMDDHYYYDGPKYFEIRSMIETHHNGWCLEEAIKPRKHKKNFFIAAECNDSPSQKFFLDYNGYLHSKNNPEKCLKRVGRWFKIDDCYKYDNAAMKWIFSTDGTIRFGHNALFAMSIPEKFTKGSWLGKKMVTALQLRKVMNRSPNENEQWMIIHEEPIWEDDYWYETETPTVSPTMSHQYPHPYPHYDPHGNNYPSYSPVALPQPTPNKPDGSKFNIAFMNMGTENMYNEAFEKARSKFEKMIVGDLFDHPPINSDGTSDNEHDWFAGTWPDRKVNTPIDDVLIGYEITDIDGVGNVLGFAGPLYIRSDVGTGSGANDGGSFTTISGIMKFDKQDFKTMSKEDIELIVLHEMAHVLGLGTLWTSFKCGTQCIPRDESSATAPDSTSNSNNEYLCDGAKKEYMYMMNSTLMISPDDCSHWSEESFLQNGSSELMTPIFEENKYQPLSRVSLASLADLGYEVNMSAADPLHLEDYHGHHAADHNNYETKPGHYPTEKAKKTKKTKKKNDRKLQSENLDDKEEDKDKHSGDDYDDMDVDEEMDHDVDVKKPSKTFMLDSSNVIRPKIQGYLYN